MTDLGLTNALHANAQTRSEYANADAAASSDGALHASESGVAYDGSSAADASYDAAAPELPELPVDVPVEAPELPVDVPELEGVSGGVTGALDGTVAGSTEGATADVGGVFDGWLDAMADAMAQLTASLSAALGL